MSEASGSKKKPGIPRWVKLFAIGALIIVLLVVAVMLALGGEHGPGLHNPTGLLPSTQLI